MISLQQPDCIVKEDQDTEHRRLLNIDKSMAVCHDTELARGSKINFTAK